MNGSTSNSSSGRSKGQGCTVFTLIRFTTLFRVRLLSLLLPRQRSSCIAVSVSPPIMAKREIKFFPAAFASEGSEVWQQNRVVNMKEEMEENESGGRERNHNAHLVLFLCLSFCTRV